MEQIISKEEVDKFMALKGKVRGSALRAYGEYILKEEGEEALNKLEDTMTELGYNLKYREIGQMNFFPIGYQALTIESIKKLFGYNAERFQKFGHFSAKFSLIIKLFMRYFASEEKVMEQVANMWEKSYTVGNLKIMEYNKEEERLVLRLENFALHPFQCEVLKGYFSAITQMVVGEEKITEETKCVFRGDEYHEFVIKPLIK